LRARGARSLDEDDVLMPAGVALEGNVTVRSKRRVEKELGKEQGSRWIAICLNVDLPQSRVSNGIIINKFLPIVMLSRLWFVFGIRPIEPEVSSSIPA
jgi:hypothetical protein